MKDSVCQILLRFFILCGAFSFSNLLQGAEEKASPPKWNYSYPAGAARGETTVITLNGEFPRWPLQVWSDYPVLHAKAAKEKGKLEVSVDADTYGSVAWLRLFDHAGASALRPLIIGDLTESLEKEPNDDFSKPQTVGNTSIVNGRLEKRGDVDTYAVELFQGQTFVASLQANRLLASPMDAILQICTSDGFVLTQNDDALGVDPQIVFTAPSDGTYLVRAFAFPLTPNSSISFSGSEQYVYRLTLTTGGFLDHAFPLALSRTKSNDLKLQGWNLSAANHRIRFPVTIQENRDFVKDRNFLTITKPKTAGSLRLPIVNHLLVTTEPWNSPARPQIISLPSVVSGRIQNPGDKHAYVFHAKKDRSITFRIEANELGFLLDPKMVLLDSTGKIISEVDDAGRRNRDGQLNFKTAADGKYTLIISDLHSNGGFRYVYRLTAAETKPNFSLALAAGEFVTTTGKSLEIPITINRSGGFAEEITISAVGLPETVSAEAVTSPAKGDSSKSVKLKIKSGSDSFNGPFQILGKAKEQKSIARFTLTQPNFHHTQAWLTILKPSQEESTEEKTVKPEK